MSKEPFYTYTKLAEHTRREHVLAAIRWLDEGGHHSFGPATKYQLVHEGKTYDPKPVVAIAYERATGELPLFHELKGGPEGANKVLERLGFKVVEIAELANEGLDWTAEECWLIVADYFDMLATELMGQPYNKAEHNRRLRQAIHRQRTSIERKHMNISAALNDLHQPYIRGYKPNVNRQKLLDEVVEEFLINHPEFFDRPEIAERIEPVDVPPVAIRRAADFFDDPPDIDIPVRPPQPWRSRRGRKTDYAMKDAMNRALGRLGEEFVRDLEQHRLHEAGRDDLSARVEWVANTQGDGMGFDVLSFDEQTEGERWLEVKTTTLGKFHPFVVTGGELACSEAEPAKFSLYRVFQFRDDRKVFALPGSLRERCCLEPFTFRAGPPYSLPKT